MRNIREKEKVASLLNLPLIDLITYADKIRKEFIGNKLRICSIINAKSGLCSEDCKFCAQASRYPTNINTYPLKSKDEIIKSALKAVEIGSDSFGIVTSGKRLSKKEIDLVALTIDELKNELEKRKNHSFKICASLGILEKDDLLKLKKAGLYRYHHNIETSENFYPHIVTTHKFQERIKTIKSAQEVGLKVCSGGIFGMGETWRDRIDMAYTLKELDVDSIPLNFLIPIKGTPLEKMPTISPIEAIKTICIFRIILKDKTIKVAAGRESILKDFQALCFLAGANGMIIGGYLTVKGREVEEDHKLIENIKQIWTE